MKKAKIMLSAITIFALVGSVLAFKAAKDQTVTYTLCNTNVTPNTCKTVNVQGIDIASVTATNRNVTVGSATLDLMAAGKGCTDATHPCTAHVYFQSTENQ